MYARLVTIRPGGGEGTKLGMRVGVLAKEKVVAYEDIPGLNSAKCHGMLRDPTHLFRRMWAAEAWAKQTPDQPKCWGKSRDQRGAVVQPEGKYFSDILDGGICESNWYEGNGGGIGKEGHPPLFKKDANALLGFDETIDDYCKERAPRDSKWEFHALRCVKADLNILSLYGERVPYNICRNLEWQSCAARGLLPGQQSKIIRFAIAPKSLDPSGEKTGKPLGKCRGWVPDKRPTGGIYGYATDDIFFLEVCLYNQICANGGELFDLEVGEPSESKFTTAHTTVFTTAHHCSPLCSPLL